jgi:prepilin-type N-terminal cleavage/methylation domain-containing protein
MNKKGFTLLEMLLVLGIISVIIIIAVRYFQQGSESSKVSDAASKIRRVIEASYDYNKITHSFYSMYVSTLITSNLLSDSDVNGPWGGQLDVEVGNVDNSILITIPSVPQTACKALQDILNNQNIDTSLFDCSKTSDQLANYPKS